MKWNPSRRRGEPRRSWIPIETGGGIAILIVTLMGVAAFLLASCNATNPPNPIPTPDPGEINNPPVIVGTPLHWPDTPRLRSIVLIDAKDHAGCYGYLFRIIDPEADPLRFRWKVWGLSTDRREVIDYAVWSVPTYHRSENVAGVWSDARTVQVILGQSASEQTPSIILSPKSLQAVQAAGILTPLDCPSPPPSEDDPPGYETGPSTWVHARLEVTDGENTVDVQWAFRMWLATCSTTDTE